MLRGDKVYLISYLKNIAIFKNRELSLIKIFFRYVVKKCKWRKYFALKSEDCNLLVCDAV
jgi:hypothetical protein